VIPVSLFKSRLWASGHFTWYYKSKAFFLPVIFILIYFGGCADAVPPVYQNISAFITGGGSSPSLYSFCTGNGRRCHSLTNLLAS
jgi:hypothetical protein